MCDGRRGNGRETVPGAEGADTATSLRASRSLTPDGRPTILATSQVMNPFAFSVETRTTRNYCLGREIVPLFVYIQRI